MNLKWFSFSSSKLCVIKCVSVIEGFQCTTIFNKGHLMRKIFMSTTKTVFGIAGRAHKQDCSTANDFPKAKPFRSLTGRIFSESNLAGYYVKRIYHRNDCSFLFVRSIKRKGISCGFNEFFQGRR